MMFFSKVLRAAETSLYIKLEENNIYEFSYSEENDENTEANENIETETESQYFYRLVIKGHMRTLEKIEGRGIKSIFYKKFQKYLGRCKNLHELPTALWHEALKKF